MSYILDALRKADQQRHRGEAPTLLTAQASAAAPARPRFSLNGWLAIALVIAGVVIGWLRPWQDDPTLRNPIPVAAAPQPANAYQAATAPSPAAVSAAAALSPAAPPVTATSAEAPPPAPSTPAAAPPPARIEVPPMPQGSVIIAPSDGASPIPVSPAVKGTSDSRPEKRVLAVSELPASIQQEVGKLAISFHVYASNPSERRVMINNALMLQGEALESGFTVEQINPEGVILGYRGYRFQRKVP